MDKTDHLEEGEHSHATQEISCWHERFNIIADNQDFLCNLSNLSSSIQGGVDCSSNGLRESANQHRLQGKKCEFDGYELLGIIAKVEADVSGSGDVFEEQ